MTRVRLIFAFFTLLLFSRCETDTQLIISDYEYFPVFIGQYQVFEVTESLYSLSGSPIHSKYYVKEQISQSYEYPNQEKIYKIERFKKQMVSQSWKIDSVWTTQLLINKAIRTENNSSIVKLYFPIQTGQFWNKNELNSFSSQKVSYQDKGKDFKIDTKVYQNTVSVVIKNDSSLISKNSNFEIYAPKLGLIYCENKNLAYCQSTPSCIGKGQIDYGFIKKMKLLEMGQEK